MGDAEGLLGNAASDYGKLAENIDNPRKIDLYRFQDLKDDTSKMFSFYDIKKLPSDDREAAKLSASEVNRLLEFLKAAERNLQTSHRLEGAEQVQLAVSRLYAIGTRVARLMQVAVD
jgi:hypothetical protein